MKSINFFLTSALIILSAYTYAQHPGGGQRGGQQGPPPIPNNKQIEKMVTDLAGEISLSADQKTKVLSIYKEHFNKVKEKTSGNRRPSRKEMETLESDFEKQVKAELTKDQTSKYEAYLKEKSKRQPPRER